MIGERFGPYELRELLGRGGMGEVWRAHDTARNREVALKRLHPHLADNRQFQIRFRREAEVAARLVEPHVIPIHDFGDVDGRLYIDMRLVEGRGLNALLASAGPLPAGRAVHIVAQTGGALAAAHRVGLWHRDVKPSNVLISEERDFVYLVDFGIAHTDEATSVTSTGFTVGTLAYMAPERFENRGDHRVDVYALGCLLYEALTAMPPFPVEGLPALLNAHLRVPPPRPTRRRPELPAALDDVVATAMAKSPDDRYPTATAFAAAARAALGEGSPGPRPAGGVAPAAARRAVPEAARDRVVSTSAATVLPPASPAEGGPTSGRSAPTSGRQTPEPGVPRRRWGRVVFLLLLVAAVLAALLLITVPADFGGLRPGQDQGPSISGPRLRGTGPGH